MTDETLVALVAKINRCKTLSQDIITDTGSRQNYFENLGFQTLGFIFQSIRQEVTQISDELDSSLHLLTDNKEVAENKKE